MLALSKGTKDFVMPWTKRKLYLSTHLSSHMPSIFSVDGFGLNNHHNLCGRTTVHIVILQLLFRVADNCATDSEASAEAVALSGHSSQMV